MTFYDEGLEVGGREYVGDFGWAFIFLIFIFLIPLVNVVDAPLTCT